MQCIKRHAHCRRFVYMSIHCSNTLHLTAFMPPVNWCYSLLENPLHMTFGRAVMRAPAASVLLGPNNNICYFTSICHSFRTMAGSSAVQIIFLLSLASIYNICVLLSHPSYNINSQAKLQAHAIPSLHVRYLDHCNCPIMSLSAGIQRVDAGQG